MQVVFTYPPSAQHDFIAIGYANGCVSINATTQDCSGINPSNGSVYKEIYMDGCDNGCGNSSDYSFAWYGAISAGDNLMLKIVALGGNCFGRYWWYAGASTSTALPEKCYADAMTQGFVLVGSENACGTCGVSLNMAEDDWGPGLEYHDGHVNAWYYWQQADNEAYVGCSASPSGLGTSSAKTTDSGTC